MSVALTSESLMNICRSCSFSVPLRLNFLSKAHKGASILSVYVNISACNIELCVYTDTHQLNNKVSTCRRRSVGGLYYLSYLDDNMLLGRAVGGGGVFVFTRAQCLDL